MTKRWTASDIPDLTGQVALVTGGNAGLGLEISKMLAAHGARVMLGCRNRAKAEAAIAVIRSQFPAADLQFVPLDLANLASVAAAAKTVSDTEPQLDLLVNNAGLMALDHAQTDDGFEMQFGVNHLGHFALTADLLALVLATPGSRIVTMSSLGHRSGRLHLDDLMFTERRYHRWPAYFQSKLANLLFTAELDRRLRAVGASTLALAAHPGMCHTELGAQGSSITNKLLALSPIVTQSVAAGALPLLRAATDPNAQSGEYYGPRRLVRGLPVLETPSAHARRADDALALWARSETLAGRQFSFG
jgi:protochlorophyllide reductase